MRRKTLAAAALCCFSVALVVLTVLLAGCSDNDGTISGSGDVERSDRDRSGGPTKKAEMPNKDGGKTTVDSGSGSSLGTWTSYGTRNNGRQAWRIPKKGPDFGSSIKVVFSDGHTVYVPNTSKNYRESDGFVFKPGLGPNGEGVNDTGTSHGGVYLHAPYGNRSKQVTFYSR